MKSPTSANCCSKTLSRSAPLAINNDDTDFCVFDLIKRPGKNDVVFGRDTTKWNTRLKITAVEYGNERFDHEVGDRADDFHSGNANPDGERQGQRFVDKLVNDWQKQTPPGRFLFHDKDMWEKTGEDRFREMNRLVASSFAERALALHSERKNKQGVNDVKIKLEYMGSQAVGIQRGDMIEAAIRHEGTKRWIGMINATLRMYHHGNKSTKKAIVDGIVAKWRNQKPRGRLVKENEETLLLREVSDEEARGYTEDMFYFPGDLFPNDDDILMPGINDVWIHGRTNLIVCQKQEARWKEEFMDLVNDLRDIIDDSSSKYAAMELLEEWEHQSPRGRILRFNHCTGLFREAVDKEAVDLVSAIIDRWRTASSRCGRLKKEITNKIL
mmetsp:Transcript_5841/g.13557  ORF Transcript_5841/g.13557 Transcript_5841/m.13557 type:complete len:384 (+) Transcript_5841:169-1320(+)